MTAEPITPRPWWMPSVRGTAVIFTGAWCVLLGVSFIDTVQIPAALLAYNGTVPLGVAALIWLAVGITCLTAVLFRRWRTAMTIAAVAHAAWAIASLFASLYGLAPRGWVTAGAYALIAELIIAVSLMTDPPWPRQRRHPR